MREITKRSRFYAYECLEVYPEPCCVHVGDLEGFICLVAVRHSSSSIVEKRGVHSTVVAQAQSQADKSVSASQCSYLRFLLFPIREILLLVDLTSFFSPIVIIEIFCFSSRFSIVLR